MVTVDASGNFVILPYAEVACEDGGPCGERFAYRRSNRRLGAIDEAAAVA